MYRVHEFYKNNAKIVTISAKKCVRDEPGQLCPTFPAGNGFPGRTDLSFCTSHGIIKRRMREVRHIGMVKSAQTLHSLHWHLYLHGNPPERVTGIFEKMIADARWLLDRQGTGAPEVFL